MCDYYHNWELFRKKCISNFFDERDKLERAIIKSYPIAIRAVMFVGKIFLRRAQELKDIINDLAGEKDDYVCNISTLLTDFVDRYRANFNSCIGQPDKVDKLMEKVVTNMMSDSNILKAIVDHETR